MSSDFDFLAEHGDTHVIRGGQRIRQEGDLPREGGPVLVTAIATLGGKRVVGTIPGSEWLGVRNPVTSPAGRYLGVLRNGMIELYDLEDGCKRWFCFVPPEGQVRPDGTTIHPSGERVAFALEDRIEIALPDGETMASASLGGGIAAVEAMCFSACGKHLWVACNGESGPDDRLQLRHGATLKVLDEVTVPTDPDGYYDGPGKGGKKLHHFQINPANNSLLMNRIGGDSQLSISFHTAKNDKIQTHQKMPSSCDETETFEPEPVSGVVFAGDGTRFWTLGRYGQLCEWNWPECQVTVEAWELDLLGEWRSRKSETQWGSLGLELNGDIAERDGLLYLGMNEGTVIVVQAGSLRPVEYPLNPLRGEPLPNGMALQRVADNTLEITEMTVRPKQAPVIVRLNSECGIVEEVYRKRGRKWIDIRKEVAWVEPRFRFERPQ